MTVNTLVTYSCLVFLQKAEIWNYRRGTPVEPRIKPLKANHASFAET